MGSFSLWLAFCLAFLICLSGASAQAVSELDFTPSIIRINLESLGMPYLLNLKGSKKAYGDDKADEESANDFCRSLGFGSYQDFKVETDFHFVDINGTYLPDYLKSFNASEWKLEPIKASVPNDPNGSYRDTFISMEKVRVPVANYSEWSYERTRGLFQNSRTSGNSEGTEYAVQVRFGYVKNVSVSKTKICVQEEELPRGRYDVYPQSKCSKFMDTFENYPRILTELSCFEATPSIKR